MAISARAAMHDSEQANCGILYAVVATRPQWHQSRVSAVISQRAAGAPTFIGVKSFTHSR